MPLFDPPLPGMVNAAVAREDREARERLAAKAVKEAYMADLRRQYPELVKAECHLYEERATAGGSEVIVLSSDKEDNRGNDGGSEGVIDDFFDIEEWRRIFLGSGDNGTGPDPMSGWMSRADWLALAKSNCY